MDSVPRTTSIQESNKSEKLYDLDLSNKDAKQLVLSAGLDLKTYQELMQERKIRRNNAEENVEKLSESQIRKWMVKHGKKHLINFDDKERYKLKQFFKSLDADGSGSIGVDELTDPLISLGIAETSEEVQKIVDSVDEDHSGQIEFKEFLEIIAGTQENKGDTAIIDFFKDMISGRLAGGQISNKLPFNLIISTVRRKKLMDSMMSQDSKDRVEGEKVMTSYSRLMTSKKKERSPDSSPTKRPSTRGGKNMNSLTDSSVSSRPGSKRF